MQKFALTFTYLLKNAITVNIKSLEINAKKIIEPINKKLMKNWKKRFMRNYNDVS